MQLISTFGDRIFFRRKYDEYEYFLDYPTYNRKVSLSSNLTTCIGTHTSLNKNKSM